MPGCISSACSSVADGTGRCALSLSSLLSVPPPQWFLRFASGLVLAHSTLSVFLGHSRLRHVARGEMPLIGGGGIPQTRGVINGRITYRHPFIEMVSKFAGGILSFSAGLSLGREGPSVQIGSYVGSLVSRWTHILKGEQKQLLAAGRERGSLRLLQRHWLPRSL